MVHSCHVIKAVFIIQYAAVHNLTVQHFEATTFGLYQAATCRLQDCTLLFINCNWVVSRWQWLFYIYTKYEIGY